MSSLEERIRAAQTVWDALPGAIEDIMSDTTDNACPWWVDHLPPTAPNRIATPTTPRVYPATEIREASPGIWLAVATDTDGNAVLLHRGRKKDAKRAARGAV